ESPSVSLEFCAGGSVLDVCRQLKCFAGFFWRCNEAKKFSRLAPEIFFAAPRNVFQTAGGPIGHGCEHGRARRRTSCSPEIGHHWLARRQPFQSVGRDRKAFGADVFAKSEKGMMPAQILNCRFHALIDLDLLDARIAF